MPQGMYRQLCGWEGNRFIAHLGGLLVHAAEQHEQDGLLDVQVPEHARRQRGRQALVDLAVLLPPIPVTLRIFFSAVSLGFIVGLIW